MYNIHKTFFYNLSLYTILLPSAIEKCNSGWDVGHEDDKICVRTAFQPYCRVFIKYCGFFFENFKIFRTLASFGFPAVCTPNFMLGPLNGR